MSMFPSISAELAAPTRERKPTTYSKMLWLLYDFLVEQKRLEYLPGVLLPPGELPMPAFRGPEVGGDACNIRMWELRSPEEVKRNFKGIPIKKSRFHYLYKDEACHIITYRLDIPIEIVDRVLDLEQVRLHKLQLEQAGYKLEEYLDDAAGEDKPGRAVRLVPSTPQPELF